MFVMNLVSSIYIIIVACLYYSKAFTRLANFCDKLLFPFKRIGASIFLIFKLSRNLPAKSELLLLLAEEDAILVDCFLLLFVVSFIDVV